MALQAGVVPSAPKNIKHPRCRRACWRCLEPRRRWFHDFPRSTRVFQCARTEPTEPAHHLALWHAPTPISIGPAPSPARRLFELAQCPDHGRAATSTTAPSNRASPAGPAGPPRPVRRRPPSSASPMLFVEQCLQVAEHRPPHRSCEVVVEHRPPPPSRAAVPIAS